jgi:lysophospholipase L1-like esterase
MTSRAWIYAGLLVAAGVGLASASKAPAPRAVPGKARILLIGDSLSVGLKTPMALLAKETNIPFAHCGAQGYTINRFVGNGTMASCVAQQLTSLKPTHVLILLGTNDEAMSASMAPQQLEAARSLVATCQSGLRKMFDDAHWFESSSIGLPTADSIGHMTPVNYCKWSGSIWNWLTRIAVSPSRC